MNREKIIFISGGETGAEIAHLRAASYLSLQTKGFILPNFETEDGKHPEYAEIYNLKETFGGTKLRNMLNITQSDLLIVFSVENDTEVINFARHGKYKINGQSEAKSNQDVTIFEDMTSFGDQGKPVIVFHQINRSKLNDYTAILAGYLIRHQPKNIMLTGLKYSENPEIEELVEQLIMLTFQTIFDPKQPIGQPKEILEKLILGEWCHRCLGYRPHMHDCNY